MELFKTIWTLRGRLLGSDSAQAAQTEAGLICRILFVRFLDEAGFFGKTGFPFESLTNSVPDSSPLDFLNDQLTLGSLLNPRSIKREGIAELASEIMPRYRFSLLPDNSHSATDSKPVVKSWVLGYIYERWIDNRKTGSYFTADALAYSIVTHALEEWLEVKYQNQFDHSEHLRSVLHVWETGTPLDNHHAREIQQWLEHVLEEIRLVDLSMGGGAFLVAALQALHRLRLFCRSSLSTSPTEHTTLVRHILSHNLYGVDIMPTAIHIAKMRLWLASLELIGIVASENLPALPNLVHGDALVALKQSTHTTQSTFLVEESADPLQAFLTARGGFDICVGNPPFIALSQRNHVTEKRAFIENWNKRHPEYELRTTSDLSNFFILQGADLLRPNGVLAYITSRNFFDTRYGKPIRRFLTQQVELRHLYTLHDHPFTQQGLKVKANTVILSLVRRTPLTPLRFQDLTVWNEPLSDEHGHVIDRDELARSANWTQTLFQDPLRSEIERRCPKKISDYSIARMGIKSGDNEFFLLRIDSDLFPQVAREESANIFIKVVRNSRDVRGCVLPSTTQYRLLNLREKIAQVERGFSTNRLKGVAKYIHQHGVAYACPQCQARAVEEHKQHPELYPHRGMCAQCPECRKHHNPCDRPVDRLSNQGHRPEWYTLSLSKPPAIAVQCIVDTEIGVFWNSARVYATDQFQTIDECSDEETTKLVYLFLCSRLARFLLEGYALHRARYDGSFMLKIQVNHLQDLPCPDFGPISPTVKQGLLQLFDRIISVRDRRSEQAKQLMNELDRVFLQILGYPIDTIDATQIQLATSLEKAVLFRWTKTRTRSNIKSDDEENHGTFAGGNQDLNPGLSSIRAFDPDQKSTRASGQQQVVGERC